MTNIDEQQAKKLKIAEVQPPLATKKPRALPHVWAKFYQIENGKTFFIGDDKAIKVAFCGFRRYARPACFVNDWGKQSQFEFIAPWTRVKTNVLIRDARPGGKSSGLPGETFGEIRNRLIDKLDLKGQVVQFPRDSAGHEGAVPSHIFSRDIVNGLNAPSVQQTGPSA